MMHPEFYSTIELCYRSNVIPAEDLKFLKRWIWEISHRFALGRNFTRVGILEFGGGVSSEMTDLTANLVSRVYLFSKYFSVFGFACMLTNYMFD